jgi:hypothetical protein
VRRPPFMIQPRRASRSILCCSSHTGAAE